MSHSIPFLGMQTVIIPTGITFILVILFISRCRSNSLPYPPGPHPDPLIGNVRQMMVERHEVEFEKWGKHYGDVNYARIFGQPLVVLNSFEAAKDLLEKRGVIYSGRPRLVLLSELMGWGDVLVHQDPGPRFRKHRRIVQEWFSARALTRFASLQKQEVYMTLSHLGNSPENLFEHIKRFASGIILNIAYGITVHAHDDKIVGIGDRATTETVSVSPGAMLVDFFPILKHWPIWMPLSGFKRHALYTRGLVQSLFDTPYQYIKAQIANGTASPCMAADLLEILNSQTGSESPNEIIDDLDVKLIVGVLYAAASDTTNATLSTFFLTMVLHPDVFKKAQTEIDKTTGGDRLLDFNDRESLPYLNCVVKEVLRYACPAPLGVPHRVTEDDKYRDYFIPKNSTVLANIWAMMRNESVFPDPYKFIPERYLGRMNEEAAMQVDSIFGFGRRACPGKWFAESNVWLLVANVIAMFDIEKALDNAGNIITPPGDYTAGYVRHPKKFPYRIKYRSEKARTIVAQANLQQS